MNVKTEIDLYNYQKGAIDKIFERFEDCPNDYHLRISFPQEEVRLSFSQKLYASI